MNSQNAHKKLSMAVCACNPDIGMRRQGSWSSLAAQPSLHGQLLVHRGTLSQGSKIETNRRGYYRPPRVSACVVVHTQLYSHMCATHTHTHYLWRPPKYEPISILTKGQRVPSRLLCLLLPQTKVPPKKTLSQDIVNGCG